MCILRISLLGEPLLAAAGGAVLRSPGPKAMALVACVATAPDKRMSRTALVELLWADAPSTSSARHALRQCLFRLRARLGPAGQVLLADDWTVGLNADLVSVDVAEVLSATTDDEIVAASAAIRGPFCAGLDAGTADFETWLRVRRGDFDRVCAGLHERAAGLLAERGDVDGAIAAAKRRLELEPYQDDAHAALIALCAGLGRRQDAAEAHAACHELFRKELGVAPRPDVDAALTSPRFARQPVGASFLNARTPHARGQRRIGAFAAGLAVAAALLQLSGFREGGPPPESPRPEMALWVGPASAGPVQRKPAATPERTSEGTVNAANHSAVRRMLDGDTNYAMLYPVGC